MKNILFVLFALVFGAAARAQTASDALLYSRTELGGTARYVGVGGAFGALGADFSALSTNPAGLAMYRTSEFILTPSMKLSTSMATLNTNPSFSDEKNKFQLDNLGVVFYKTPRSSDWSTFNIGLGFNQLANFSQSIYYEGLAPGSIMNSFWEDAAAVGFDENQFYPFTSRLAYNTGAFYDDLGGSGNLSYDFAGNEADEIRHTQSVDVSGRMNEMVLSFAGNYKERIMIGGTFGFPFVRYERDSQYEEYDDASNPGNVYTSGNVDFFDNLAYTDFLMTEGIGFNAKLGLIYRLNQMVRVGAALHSPTFFSLTDSYYTDFTYAYKGSDNTPYSNSERSPDGKSDYALRTPWKAIFSGAALFGKNGFVSADLEVVDYSNNRYNFTKDINSTENAAAEQAVNRAIGQEFGQTVNFRLGGEIAADIFRARAGVGLYGQPQAGETGFDRSFSAGVGVRGKSVYADLGFRFNRNEQTLSPYAVSQNPLNVKVFEKSTNLMLTLGFKF